ncbi:MAG: CdaR family protein [Armatimonadota bacterium]|nr:CdaR family protein [Armatimonadota bacterium]MDR7451986.1 CdaR family protein [Armatimonadota bacterium]MDR7467877.1 CdaR family protein [Armatimonadota bacterium]MDR7494270.1 CdaR family protein [Armatimonadota bacterium]MDR7500051.1 CdaR family protein [Armatimonadota bacterium]
MRFRRINEQTLLLVLSFLISVALWAYVTSARITPAPQATTKVVAVVPAITGEPAYGYSLLGIRVTPLTVTLTGPPAVLAPIQSVSTEPVNIGGQTRDFVQEVAVLPPPGTQVGGRVRVAVQIVPAVAVTTVRGIPVQVPPLPGGYVAEVQPDRVAVEVQGPVTVVNRLRAADFTARVDGLEATVGRQRAQVRVQAPPQVEVLNITPAGVTVTVRRGG